RVDPETLVDQCLEAFEDLLSFHPLLHGGDAGPRCGRRIRVPCRHRHGMTDYRTGSGAWTIGCPASPRTRQERARAGSAAPEVRAVRGGGDAGRDRLLG